MANEPPVPPPAPPPIPERRKETGFEGPGGPVLGEGVRGAAKTGLRHAVKAAFHHSPSRPADQALFWIVRTTIEATKTLGFPVVMAFILAAGFFYFGNKFLTMQQTSLATQQQLLSQISASSEKGQDRATEAIKELAASQNESNEITRTLMTEVGLRPPPKRQHPAQP
jgi:hypothetical protein